MIPKFRDFNPLHNCRAQAGILLIWPCIFLLVQTVSSALL